MKEQNNGQKTKCWLHGVPDLKNMIQEEVVV